MNIKVAELMVKNSADYYNDLVKTLFNIYNGKPINDAHLVRMFELYDSRKNRK